MKMIMKKFISVVVVLAMVASIVVVSPATEAKAVTESKDYTIQVNLGTNCTTIFNKEGKAIKAMICSPSSETPTGTFYIPVKYRWHEMIGNCYAQYCSRISFQHGVLFHSVWYYKNGDKSTMSVSAYNVMGQKASHGCVRLLCKDAKWIYDHCAVGTKIKIFWGSSKDDPLKRPGFTPIRNGKWTDWDPTDPDPKNPYNKYKPSIKAEQKTVEFGTKLKDMTELVEIKDSAGNVLTRDTAKIKVTGKVKTNKIGTYKVTYFVKDALGNEKTETFSFKVVDSKKPVISGAKSLSDIAMGETLDIRTKVLAKAATGKSLKSKLKISVKYKGKAKAVKKSTYTFDKKGTYSITYSVKGLNKKVAKKTVKYQVIDKRVKFALTKSAVTIKQNEAFNPLSYVKYLTTYKGVTLKKKNIEVTGTVNTAVPGEYTVTLKATHNKKEYSAVTKTIKVTVEPVAEETTVPAETTTAAEETTVPEETTTEAEEITTLY